MPTTRRRRSRRRATATLLGLGIPVQLDMLVGWHPPRTPFEVSRSSFSSYADFLATYREVRDEFLSRFTNAASSFAEQLHQAAVAQPKADVETLGRRLSRRRQGRT